MHSRVQQNGTSLGRWSAVEWMGGPAGIPFSLPSNSQHSIFPGNPSCLMAKLHISMYHHLCPALSCLIPNCLNLLSAAILSALVCSSHCGSPQLSCWLSLPFPYLALGSGPSRPLPLTPYFQHKEPIQVHALPMMFLETGLTLPLFNLYSHDNSRPPGPLFLFPAPLL